MRRASPLRWPSRSVRAIAKLFRPVQEVDIYVEDADDGAMYSRLFSRILEGHPKVVRVFPLGNRDAVLKEARAVGRDARPRIYLVDGDFPWVRGEVEPLPENVIRLEAYCIENLLFDGRAAHRVLSEEANLPDSDAEGLLAFNQWSRELEECLLPLAVAMAILNQVSPDDATVSRLPGDVLETSRPGSIGSLSVAKVNGFCAQIRARILEIASPSQLREWEDLLMKRAKSLREPLRVVTGKDVLMCLLHLRLHELCRGGVKLRRKSLRIRLAGEIDVARASDLASGIRRLAS